MNQFPAWYPSKETQIDKAIVEIKTKNETIAKMEGDMKALMSENRLLLETKSELQSLERKHTQKAEEISILRDTIKTLYEENERLGTEKTQLSKEAASSKEALVTLKKKYKRQEEEIGGYKSDIRKATEMAEERLEDYIKSDQQKQQQIKNLTAENEKLKADLSRKERHLNSANKKVEDLKDLQRLCEESSVALQVAQQERKSVSQELDALRDKYHGQKRKLLEENESLLKEIEKLNDRADRQAQQHKQAHSNVSELAEKCGRYEQEIVARTDKIKEKNKQIKLFTEELAKMQQKVEELSKMAERLMQQNDSLKKDLSIVQGRNEQYKQFYAQLGRLKGEIHSKKESELAKLTDSLEKLARLNYI